MITGRSKNMRCNQCKNDPEFVPWYEAPMNEEIRKRLTIQPPVVFYLSFRDAAAAWGPYITDGLKGEQQ